MNELPPDTLNDTLNDALGRQEIDLPQDQVARLEDYCRLLWDWNQKLNLTRHTDYEKFVCRDVVDTLQLSKLIEPNEAVLDVGSGGGAPGVILAIVRPDLKVSLSESVTKKAAALSQIVDDLNLAATVYRQRAEETLETERFDVLTARAVGPLWKLCKWFEPHWDSIGRLLTIKGPRWPQERNEARHRGVLRALELRVAATYPMPGTDSESVVLKLWLKKSKAR